MIPVSALGALAALSIAIFLILKKVPPAYGMIVGALAGGLIGGADLTQTVALMIGGAQGITTAVMRILAAGVLAGVLIESGAATTIAETIVKKLGETRALLALALATLILTAVGVFVDVAVITVAPIALAIARRADLSKAAILLAMIGGGKAGNVMSPNPNAIAASDAFHLPLTSVMAAGIIPGLFGLVMAYWLAKRLNNKGSKVAADEVVSFSGSKLPGFGAAISAPLVAILLLAPISGALMSLATASTTAGTVVASNVFSSTLIELGISSLAGAAMIHAGATVFDHMPHGSFFHATGGSVHMGVGERLKLIPYETAVGLTIAAVSTLMFGVFGLA
ncbi:hypothetical protein VO71_04785 [Aeromonas salmonicida subsp. smithia]|uniref:GntP family permease n=1 Tax=Aeromonas salmonicida TaxID=645 RepID=UPI0007310317|nr:SLC13 family permease [Aeromonas salmonicida]KTA94124.1 hypothetical protein VO71_04785 [Aeromonas salmonicida subsp. smithia]